MHEMLTKAICNIINLNLVDYSLANSKNLISYLSRWHAKKVTATYNHFSLQAKHVTKE